MGSISFAFVSIVSAVPPAVLKINGLVSLDSKRNSSFAPYMKPVKVPPWEKFNRELAVPFIDNTVLPLLVCEGALVPKPKLPSPVIRNASVSPEPPMFMVNGLLEKLLILVIPVVAEKSARCVVPV